jgi:hypothetical protein
LKQELEIAKKMNEELQDVVSLHQKKKQGEVIKKFS